MRNKETRQTRETRRSFGMYAVSPRGDAYVVHSVAIATPTLDSLDPEAYFVGTLDQATVIAQALAYSDRIGA